MSVDRATRERGGATHVERPLGPLHVAAIVVGAIVGVGIFFTPASLARALPSPAWILGVWLLGGVVSAAGALVFADLGSRFPRAGGVYVFLREGFGPLGPGLAFLYGWLQLLVIQPGSMGVIAIVLVDHVAFFTGPLTTPVKAGAAVLTIALFTIANLLGLKTGGRIQVGMAALKVTALVLLIAGGIAWGKAGYVWAPRTEKVAGSIPSWLVLGLIPVLFSFGGAYHGTYVAGSVRDPERSVPRGILGGVAVVLIGYLAVNVALLRVLGHDGLAASASPAAEVASRALGASAGKVVAAGIALSAAGILNTVCLGFPFVVYAMARDGLFFRRAAELHPRTGRPVLAVAAQGAFACVAVIVGASRVDVLLTGIAFADALFQALVAVIVIRRPTSVEEGRGGITSPKTAAWIFLLVELGLAIGCLVQKPRESAVGAGMLVVGVAVWLLFRPGRRAAGDTE